MKLHNSFMCLETSYMFQIRQNSFFFFLFGGGGGGIGGRAERERKGWLGQLAFFKYMFQTKAKKNTVKILHIGTEVFECTLPTQITLLCLNNMLLCPQLDV